MAAGLLCSPGWNARDAPGRGTMHKAGDVGLAVEEDHIVAEAQELVAPCTWAVVGGGDRGQVLLHRGRHGSRDTGGGHTMNSTHTHTHRMTQREGERQDRRVAAQCHTPREIRHAPNERRRADLGETDRHRRKKGEEKREVDTKGGGSPEVGSSTSFLVVEGKGNCKRDAAIAAEQTEKKTHQKQNNGDHAGLCCVWQRGVAWREWARCFWLAARCWRQALFKFS
jgi:hypothetical protein